MVSAADKAPLWRKMEKMNMRDLSRDDDFLSSMLIESLGTGDEPLTVHKMDLTHKIPAHEPTEVLEIVQKYIVHGKSSRSSSNRIKQAVDALLQLSPVKGYLRGKSESQRNGFATHASRYFELYMPGGSVEISRTHRYSHKTGKAELCIIATRNLAAGEVITDLKGSLADLTHTEDEMLRRKDSVTGRKDFSVIYSRHKKLSHLFLGPARFVNHDCQHNVQLFRDGRLVSFRVLKPIGFGQELTAHYGNSYFGRKNKDCLCETCERNKVGGYAPRLEGDDPDVSDSDISETSEIDRSARFWDVGEQEGRANLHERRTRRGTYALDARHARQLSLPVTGNTAIEPAAAVIQELDAEAVAQSLEGVAARRAAEAAAEAVDAVMRAAEAATVAAEAAVQAVAATESTSSTSGTLVNSSTTPETIVSTLSSLSELDGVDVEMNDHPPCSPTPQPEPPSQPETALPPPRAPTPLCDIPLEPTPAAIKRIDLDTYKGNGLTAHFPPLVRIKDTEAVARLILARHDLGPKMTAHDLPSSAFHPLLEHALGAGKYPKISSDGQTLHFLASPALVDPKMTTYDFFDCGALAFPHTLVEITDKVAITAMILTRRDLQRRSNWQGLPWPEWSPLLAKAVKEGRYPHFPAIEKRGDPPVFYASLSLAGPVGRVHSLISPHPVGFDIPRHQLTFLNEYEWQHVRQQPEMYRLDHTCCWEGLPWPETNAPLLDNMYRAKKWPVFPEIDDPEPNAR
ncbi:hypothetical protein BKA62DRAFT_269667 [Auriculariales sp. MPI-PUGE-AT-0066]|nr:hypothetical protein BKA62DRAFT_269667 [Auriculariales sp. MPI-PUGE-AT-0066]